ncbi:MAG: ROK family protein [Cyanobacteria bacterium J06597_1]
MLVLCIDIGGSHIKGALVTPDQEMVSDRLRIETPRPAQPQPIIDTIAELSQPLDNYQCISVGFPGIVINGITQSAVNLHPDWQGFPLASTLEQRLAMPTRVANDADIQGYGVIEGIGVELVVTLGTGFGSALFVDGVLVPNLEMGHHPFRKGDTYEQQLGNAARKKEGNRVWNRRLQTALGNLQYLFSCRKIYLGGGNAKKVAFPLTDNVEIVSNRAGIYGGVELWREKPTGSTHQQVMPRPDVHQHSAQQPAVH